MNRIALSERSFFFRSFSAVLSFVFIITSTVVPFPAQAQLISQVIQVPSTFVCLKAITINPDNPLEFDFIFETADRSLDDQAFQQEALTHSKHFLSALTVPEKEQWVNLSPYEANRIIPESFGQTGMGRELLIQDYFLKQLVSTLMSPENETGRKFWDKIYEKTQQKLDFQNLPIESFNKVWILPDKASVYEHNGTAFVTEARLKVMMEEDYVALQHQQAQAVNVESAQDSVHDVKDLVRQVVIPEIEKSINEDPAFEKLRQIYHAMILATWFKMNLKESLLGRAYVDQRKMSGIESSDVNVPQKTYEQYLELFRKGVSDSIKEEYDPATQQMVTRKYFTGGGDFVNLSRQITAGGGVAFLAASRVRSPRSARIAFDKINNKAMLNQITAVIPLDDIGKPAVVKIDAETFGDQVRDYSGLSAGNIGEVFQPNTERQLADYLKKSNESGTPIVFWGAGTGLTGGAVITEGQSGNVVALDQMAGILEVHQAADDTGDSFAVVQPGVRLSDLQEAAKARGLFYPPDPTEQSASIGGTIATNATGARTFLYGSTRDYVRRIRVMLANGDVLDIRRGDVTADKNGQFQVVLTNGETQTLQIPMDHQMPDVFKHQAGYFFKPGMDLIDLFIGSEGTLGVITEAEVKLIKKPEGAVSGVIFFETEEKALRFVSEAKRISLGTRRSVNELSKSAINARALEYIDAPALQLVKDRYPQIPDAVLNQGAAVYFEQEVTAQTEDSLSQQWMNLAEGYSPQPDYTWFAPSHDELQQSNFKAFRHAVPEEVNAKSRSYGQRKISTDFVVPDQYFAELLRLFKAKTAEAGLEYATFGHAGNSHLHLNIFPKSAAQRQTAWKIYGQWAEWVIDHGGTVSGEHGIGKNKSPYLKRLYPQSVLEVLGRIKKTLDPKLILGRDNIFEYSFLEELEINAAMMTKLLDVQLQNAAKQLALGGSYDEIYTPEMRKRLVFHFNRFLSQRKKLEREFLISNPLPLDQSFFRGNEVVATQFIESLLSGNMDLIEKTEQVKGVDHHVLFRQMNRLIPPLPQATDEYLDINDEKMMASYRILDEFLAAILPQGGVARWQYNLQHLKRAQGLQNGILAIALDRNPELKRLADLMESKALKFNGKLLDYIRFKYDANLVLQLKQVGFQFDQRDWEESKSVVLRHYEGMYPPIVLTDVYDLQEVKRSLKPNEILRVRSKVNPESLDIGAWAGDDPEMAFNARISDGAWASIEKVREELMGMEELKAVGANYKTWLNQLPSVLGGVDRFADNIEIGVRVGSLESGIQSLTDQNVIQWDKAADIGIPSLVAGETRIRVYRHSQEGPKIAYVERRSDQYDGFEEIPRRFDEKRQKQIQKAEGMIKHQKTYLSRMNMLDFVRKLKKVLGGDVDLARALWVEYFDPTWIETTPIAQAYQKHIDSILGEGSWKYFIDHRTLRYTGDLQSYLRSKRKTDFDVGRKVMQELGFIEVERFRPGGQVEWEAVVFKHPRSFRMFFADVPLEGKRGKVPVFATAWRALKMFDMNPPHTKFAPPISVKKGEEEFWNWPSVVSRVIGVMSINDAADRYYLLSQWREWLQARENDIPAAYDPIAEFVSQALVQESSAFSGLKQQWLKFLSAWEFQNLQIQTDEIPDYSPAEHVENMRKIVENMKFLDLSQPSVTQSRMQRAERIKKVTQDYLMRQWQEPFVSHHFAVETGDFRKFSLMMAVQLGFVLPGEDMQADEFIQALFSVSADKRFSKTPFRQQVFSSEGRIVPVEFVDTLYLSGHFTREEWKELRDAAIDGYTWILEGPHIEVITRRMGFSWFNPKDVDVAIKGSSKQSGASVRTFTPLEQRRSDLRGVGSVVADWAMLGDHEQVEAVETFLETYGVGGKAALTDSDFPDIGAEGAAEIAEDLGWTVEKVDATGNRVVVSKAMLDTSEGVIKTEAFPGGIDLDPAALNMNVERSGDQIRFSNDVNIDPAMIQGLEPKIIRVNFIENFPMLLGFDASGAPYSSESVDLRFQKAMMREENT